MRTMTASNLAKIELAKRELARRHYYPYLQYCYGAAWTNTRMAEFLAGSVEKFLLADTGNAYDILIIETPPQHGKSMTITESLPSWVAGRLPEWRIIQASYNEETAERFCRRNKEKIAVVGKTLFGISIGNINRSTEYELEGHAGRMISRGIMSGITGNPANLVIIDDPIKNRLEADSPTFRRRLWDEWQNSIKSRLAAGAKVILIMTPWHEDDLRARMIASEKHVNRIRLPVEAEENDPLGRKPGDPLCPELGKDEKWLKQYKETYLSDPGGGARAWSALYQCSPRIEGGNMVHRDWWRYYDQAEKRVYASQIISVDAAFKDGDDNDFVAITVWGKIGEDYYLQYCRNAHLNFTATLATIDAVRKLYPGASRVLIEDKANGSAVIQVLAKRMVGVIPINPKGGKVARVNAVSAAIESGHVFLPRGEPWVEEYIDQWSAFPEAAHDDMVDSSSQALSYMLFSSGAAYNDEPLSEAEKEAMRVADAEEQAFVTGDIYDIYEWEW